MQESPTILIVDDEPAVQRFMATVLQGHGYRVLQARNCIHALEMCRDHQWTIHLLITDMLMPEMNGRELAAQAVSIQDAMRVLYVSGYVGSVLMDALDLDPTITFLQKPFMPATLLRKVHQILQAPCGDAC